MRHDTELYVSPWMQSTLVPDTIDVAGVVCGPITLWHLWILECTGNPYACGGLRDRDAAAELLIYCTRDMQGGRGLYLVPRQRAKAIKKMHARLERVPFDQLDCACRDYFRTCTRVPDHAHPTDESGKPLGGSSVRAPWQFHVLEYLTGGDVSKVEQSWNAPYAVSRCLYDAWRESEGSKSLLPENRQRAKDHFDELDEAAARLNVNQDQLN